MPIPLELLAKAGAVFVGDGGDSIPRIGKGPDLTEAIDFQELALAQYTITDSYC